MDLGLITFIIVGFIGQMIDGALGMAYGVSSTSFLLSLGISPAVASASVHTAEVFTTGVSGISHLIFVNVRKKLFVKLVIPGILGGILGAYLLSSVPGKKIKPFVAAYLFLMGLRILVKSFKPIQEKEIKSRLLPLGFAGGLFDAIGGGGWGPIVTSTLIARGNNPRLTIGSVNFAEFFVTLAEAVTFITMIKLTHWKVIVGLIVGGIIAAPLAAFMCKKLPTKLLMIIVGILIMLLSLRTIYISFF